MDEEKIAILTEAETENEAVVNVEDTELVIKQEEIIEYIEVEPIEEMAIEFEESIGSVGGGNGEITHYSLPDRNDSDQHIMGAITGLEDILKRLSAVKESIYSINSGFAEFRPWLKGGYYKTDSTFSGTGGIGYFVSLVTATGNIDGNNIYIDICRKRNADGTVDTTDVYGVTVASSGICGYQDIAYDILDGSVDKSNNQDYAKVCLLGDVRVRVTAEDHLKIKVGDYVVPNEDGYATKSENNVGFKVISKGQIETAGSSTTAWYYVDIALVPQNDNVSRVMEELEHTRGSLNNVILDVGNMGDVITNMQDVTIQMSGKVDGFEDVLNESVVKVDTQLAVAQEAITKAQEVANQAEQKINEVSLEYAEAVNKADEAQKAVTGVLDDVNDLRADLQPLAEWKGKDGASGTVGFVAQANKDSTTLASMTEAFGKNGSDFTAIIQKIDENGAAIQHLVSHVDKYILGEHSPAYGLSLEETIIIQPGTIYVTTFTDGVEEKYSTEEEDITFTFEYGKSYIWQTNDYGDYMWAEYKSVYTTANSPSSAELNDLWYCWQGVYSGNKLVYNPGVLYCWNEKWVPVASVNNNSTSRVVGLVNQTAEKWNVTYVAPLAGKVSDLEVTVDGISTTVQNEVKDQISSIHQTAEEIMMGVYEPDGSSSLGLLLNGMTSTSTSVTPVLVKTVLAVPPDADRYSSAPIWDGEGFVFVGEPGTSAEYIYYFDPEDTSPHTYYCVAKDGKYELYGINNIAMANLSTRVTNTESEVESWTRFQKGQNETMTSINQTSDEAGAAISSMVYGDFRECVEIKLELTDEEKATISTDRYNEQPKWENKKFVFEGDKIENGEYCNGNETSYYKLLYRDEEVVGYEKYQMKSSPYAAVVQKVDADGNAYAGLVAGDDDNIGSMFIKSINNSSEATINADKITLHSGAYGNATCSKDSLSVGSYYFQIGNTTYKFSIEEALTEQCTLIFDIGNKQLYINNRLIESLAETHNVTDMTKLTFTLPTNSNLTVEANKISQVVNAIGDNGEVTAASIVSSINNAESTVKIKANHLIFNASEDLKISAKNVEIDGTTTLSSLFTEGTTTIDGSKITTGTIVVGAKDVKIGETGDLSSLLDTEDDIWGTTVINGGMIKTGSITADQIAVGAITADMIAVGTTNNSWLTTKADGTTVINGGMIATDNLYVNAANITGTLTADKIDAENLEVQAANVKGKLTSRQIDTDNLYVAGAATISGTISANKITTGTLDCSNFNVTNLSASSITTGTLSVDRIISSNGLIRGYNGATTNNGTGGICMCMESGYQYVAAVTNSGSFLKVQGYSASDVYAQIGVGSSNYGCYATISADDININGNVNINGYAVQFEKV